jgi:hypothetical protein
MAFDSERQRIIVFGGTGDSDIWEWDGVQGVWEKRVATGLMPGAVEYPAMAFDLLKNRTLVIEGDMSIWEWDGVLGQWFKAQPTIGAVPTSRQNHAIVYDSDANKVLLYGQMPLGSCDGTLWEWDSRPRDSAAQYIKVPFYKAGVENFEFKSVMASFAAGGEGYSGRTKVSGAMVRGWVEDRWVTLTDSSNSNGPDVPGEVAWSSSDPDLIGRMMFGPEQYLIFAATPAVPNGVGDGKIAVRDVRVTVKYKIKE